MRTIDFLQMGHSQAAMKASDIAYENEQLRQQLAAKDAEIERLRTIENIADEYGIVGFVDIESLREQLETQTRRADLYESAYKDLYDENAASQAREQQLRALVQRLIDATPGHAGQCSGLKCRERYCYSCNDEAEADEYLQSVFDLCHEANKALALPQDTAALEAMIAKAGEVMRERCRKVAFDMAYADSMAVAVSQTIRALPGVTMEDF